MQEATSYTYRRKVLLDRLQELMHTTACDVSGVSKFVLGRAYCRFSASRRQILLPLMTPQARMNIDRTAHLIADTIKLIDKADTNLLSDTLRVLASTRKLS